MQITDSNTDSQMAKLMPVCMMYDELGDLHCRLLYHDLKYAIVTGQRHILRSCCEK